MRLEREEAEKEWGEFVGWASGVVRPTVQNYFEILVDTLLGYWLQPWKLKPGNKQVAHPKFYLFDSGVAGVVGESGLCANAGGVWATFGDISGQ